MANIEKVLFWITSHKKLKQTLIKKWFSCPPLQLFFSLPHLSSCSSSFLPQQHPYHQPFQPWHLQVQPLGILLIKKAEDACINTNLPKEWTMNGLELKMNENTWSLKPSWVNDSNPCSFTGSCVVVGFEPV